ncbi:MAG: hypothetical protein Q4Q19_07315 [Methanobrevibacter sp.]|jgi:hypothetical protein|nr:hypothetical protein [uncultured Methanobrevibacter sp.]MDO5828052.1 hypothetical protein [Methanobrevibacter sp.]
MNYEKMNYEDFRNLTEEERKKVPREYLIRAVEEYCGRLSGFTINDKHI